ncbi:966_t:CDS:2 [Ambispora gerdemannii]|uniref:966_t:CDS:1 n=1 Tax=Ambispora gerdemannii TaxID=144530 RepID=A0A9N9ASG4_9GLOM|nr:966_t:CDS:2 [Ambispora gerdemannii]
MPYDEYNDDTLIDHDLEPLLYFKTTDTIGPTFNYTGLTTFVQGNKKDPLDIICPTAFCPTGLLY